MIGNCIILKWEKVNNVFGPTCKYYCRQCKEYMFTLTQEEANKKEKELKVRDLKVQGLCENCSEAKKIANKVYIENKEVIDGETIYGYFGGIGDYSTGYSRGCWGFEQDLTEYIRHKQTGARWSDNNFRVLERFIEKHKIDVSL